MVRRHRRGNRLEAQAIRSRGRHHMPFAAGCSDGLLQRASLCRLQRKRLLVMRLFFAIPLAESGSIVGRNASRVTLCDRHGVNLRHGVRRRRRRRSATARKHRYHTCKKQESIRAHVKPPQREWGNPVRPPNHPESLPCIVSRTWPRRSVNLLPDAACHRPSPQYTFQRRSLNYRHR